MLGRFSSKMGGTSWQDRSKKILTRRLRVSNHPFSASLFPLLAAIWPSVFCREIVSALSQSQARQEGTCHQKLEEWLPKRRDDMVDLGVQVVGAEEWPPSHEDRVGDFEHSDVDFGVCCRESAHEVLRGKCQNVSELLRGAPEERSPKCSGPGGCNTPGSRYPTAPRSPSRR